VVRGLPSPVRGTRMRSRTGIICGASPHWPGVTSRASGLQPPSLARWILLVSPPRDLPSPSSGRCCRGLDLFFRCPRSLPAGASGVLVGTAGRRVDAHHGPVDPVLDISVGLDGLEYPLPGAVGGPASVPFVDRLPLAEPLRQVSPREPRPLTEQDPVDHPLVAGPPPTAPPAHRQMRLQTAPLLVRQITTAHDQLHDHGHRNTHDPPDTP
jgi:hypothetical protein